MSGPRPFWLITGPFRFTSSTPESVIEKSFLSMMKWQTFHIKKIIIKLLSGTTTTKIEEEEKIKSTYPVVHLEISLLFENFWFYRTCWIWFFPSISLCVPSVLFPKGAHRQCCAYFYWMILHDLLYLCLLQPMLNPHHCCAYFCSKISSYRLCLSLFLLKYLIDKREIKIYPFELISSFNSKLLFFLPHFSFLYENYKLNDTNSFSCW